MVILILQDDNTYLAVEPGKLQLRQMEKGQVAVGFDVTLPLPDAKEGETEVRFRPLINYPCDLLLPQQAVPSEQVASGVKEVRRRSGRKSMRVPDERV